MKCIVEINGREAIPVRAIPFVEGWRQLSPDVVARGFSKTSQISELLCDLAAHHLSDNGIGDMLPKEWDCIVDALEALEAELDAKEPDRTKSRPEWLERSIKCLPSHCFVWCDEFKASFQSQFGFRKSIHGGVVAPTTFANPDNIPERTGEHDLNFDPRIPPEMAGIVFEGIPKRESERANVLGGRAETTYLNIIGAMLVLMLGKSPAGKPYSVFDNQAAIIDALLGHYEDKPGISERTLEDKFAAAKRSLAAN
jgi:hypothetical protein